MDFVPHTPVAPDLPDDEKKARQAENRAKTLDNLVKQLPAEATGVYLMGLDLFKDSPLWLTIAAVLGAGVLLYVRAQLNSTLWIYIATLVSYVLWVYAIGNGPIQFLLTSLHVTLPANVGTFLIFVWTTVITVAANRGKI